MLKLDNSRGDGIYLYMTDILLHSITCSLLYGHSALNDMTMVCFKEWTDKMENYKINSAPRLSLLSHANE